MSFQLHWSVVAERDLRAIPWRFAAAADAAVMRFAATGWGNVRRVSETDPNRLKLRSPGAETRLFIDWRARVIHVQRVFRRD